MLTSAELKNKGFFLTNVDSWEEGNNGSQTPFFLDLASIPALLTHMDEVLKIQKKFPLLTGASFDKLRGKVYSVFLYGGLGFEPEKDEYYFITPYTAIDDYTDLTKHSGDATFYGNVVTLKGYTDYSNFTIDIHRNVLKEVLSAYENAKEIQLALAYGNRVELDETGEEKVLLPIKAKA